MVMLKGQLREVAAVPGIKVLGTPWLSVCGGVREKTGGERGEEW